MRASRAARRDGPRPYLPVCACRGAWRRLRVLVSMALSPLCGTRLSHTSAAHEGLQAMSGGDEHCGHVFVCNVCKLTRTNYSYSPPRTARRAYEQACGLLADYPYLE